MLYPSNLPITSLNFYRGDATAAAAFLRKRLFALVVVNPWLCARAVKRPGAPWYDCCELWVPLRPNPKDVLVELVSETLAPGMVRCCPRASRARASTANELNTFPNERATLTRLHPLNCGRSPQGATSASPTPSGTTWEHFTAILVQ
jgi:hypothetical protein